jgi:hypothetical protein
MMVLAVIVIMSLLFLTKETKAKQRSSDRKLCVNCGLFYYDRRERGAFFLKGDEVFSSTCSTDCEMSMHELKWRQEDQRGNK